MIIFLINQTIYNIIMKRLIRKILKEESLKQSLKDQVKEFGWKDTAELVNGSENLKKLSVIKTPIDFLNLYNDLDVVQSEERPILTLFRYKKHNNLMVYDRKKEIVYLDYDKIWLVLRDDFGLNLTDTQQLIKEWLGEVYNLSGITTTTNLDIQLPSWMRPII
jgi:hypothetical protein